MPEEGAPVGPDPVDLCESGQVVEAGGTVVTLPVPCTRVFIDRGRPPDEDVSRAPSTATRPTA